VARRAFPPGYAFGVLSRRDRSRRRRGKSVRARLWTTRGGTAARAAVLSPLPCGHDPRGHCRRRLHLPLHVGVHVALVMGARHGARPCAREFARWLRLSRHGEHGHACPAARLRPAGRARRRLRLQRDPRQPPLLNPRRARSRSRLDRHGIQGRSRAAPCLASACASRGTEPRVRPFERRHDQGRGLRFRAHRVRPHGRARLATRSPSASHAA
jgi:hypothetical protein